MSSGERPWYASSPPVSVALCASYRLDLALAGFGRGLEIPQESLTKGVTREQVVEGLRPLLALPVEVVLPAHRAPTDRAALERALS
jgi:hypothetical protein